MDPNQVKYKFGVCVPRNYTEVMHLDKENRNTYWGDAVQRELDQIFSYHTFCDLGLGGLPGHEYKKIKVRLVFDVKADGKRKGRLVACGDMTPEHEEAVYSSVATLCSLRIIIFLTELNGLTLMQGDIRNAYFKLILKKRFTLLLDLNLDTRLGTTSSLTRHCMVYIPVVSVFMRNCQVFYMVSDLSIPMLILMSGSMIEVRYGNIS